MTEMLKMIVNDKDMFKALMDLATIDQINDAVVASKEEYFVSNHDNIVSQVRETHYVFSIDDDDSEMIDHLRHNGYIVANGYNDAIGQLQSANELAFYSTDEMVDYIKHPLAFTDMAFTDIMIDGNFDISILKNGKPFTEHNVKIDVQQMKTEYINKIGNQIIEKLHEIDTITGNDNTYEF